ncbi:hypothetical protein [Dolichospermum flos-aquae]|uniref:Uncharacterized protein n=1 Tax=Dolichospermum flos-aquae CCAP 1403/13F TaxID=315271 RepID=A0A6H2BVL9_DOLFA|nr:hypothetical protein [Dolichospermum flos-aquae]QJB43277.1 hypothetical protein HGD76_02565 [Dolichospermum flos-aquae CCAP 1403/13F]
MRIKREENGGEESNFLKVLTYVEQVIVISSNPLCCLKKLLTSSAEWRK